MSLGRVENDNTGKFNMSYLATRLSQEVNGVSKLHGEVSRSMLNVLWPGYLEEELFIGHVTNGVHLPTWLSERVERQYYEKMCRKSDFDQRTDQNGKRLMESAG